MGKVARLYAKRGRRDEARKLLEEERELAEKHGLLENAADAVLDLARLENCCDVDQKREESVKIAIAQLEKLS